ncbi:MAG: ABC transporter ATP-binding protein/permease [Anaerolineae bacterium]|nr:ABC transporter ATP-binding protein/permease [Anaerolineae bacterium]
MKSTWRLMQYLKPYWFWALLAPLLMMVEVWMDLMQPRLIQTIIDEGIATGSMQVVLNTGLRMIGVAFIGALGGMSCGVFAVLASESYGADMRSALFRKVHSLSFSNMDELETGSLVTRLTNDVTQMQNMIGMMLRMLVRGPMTLIGSLVMAIATAPRLSLLFVVLMPMVLAIITVLITKAFPLFKQVQGKVDRLNTVMQESLMGVRVVKAFVRGDHEEARFGAANEDLRALAVKAIRTVSVGWPLMMITINLGVSAVIWFGGRSVIAGSMQIGQIVAFVNYLLNSLFSLMMVSMLVMSFSQAEASAQRINEVFDAVPDVQNRPDALRTFGPSHVTLSGNGAGRAEGEVVFENVTFAYDGKEHEPVLRDVSFTARPGETVAILGATGAGKSTLVHLIPRFYDVDSGRVTVDGVDVRAMDTDVLRRNVAVALQDPVLFSGTIRDNIRYGRPEAGDEEVEAAAKMAQAHEFITSFPDGYDTELGQRGVNLSGGQKQRVAIARALLVDPAVLILDDSTSSVDVETEAVIQEELERFIKEKGEHPRTTFVIAQRISTVLNADKILVLDDGAIAAEGTHTELMASSPIYREIYDSQLGGGVLSNG